MAVGKLRTPGVPATAKRRARLLSSQTWTAPAALAFRTVRVRFVAGGASGSVGNNTAASGGGGGEVFTALVEAIPGTGYPAVIGAGGVGPTVAPSLGVAGGNTTMFGLTARGAPAVPGQTTGGSPGGPGGGAGGGNGVSAASGIDGYAGGGAGSGGGVPGVGGGPGGNGNDGGGSAAPNSGGGGGGGTNNKGGSGGSGLIELEWEEYLP